MANNSWEKNGSPFERDCAKNQGMTVQELRERSRAQRRDERKR